MIYTSNYSNCISPKSISISGDKGKEIGFTGKSYSNLAPRLSFWAQWYNSIGKIPEQDNNDFYIREYYKTVLSMLNPKTVYKELKGSILLCYEEPMLFCHRHIVAAWLEDELGIVVPEIKIVNGKKIKIEKNIKIKDDYRRIILNKS